MNRQIPRTLLIGILASILVLAIIYVLTPLPRGGQEAALTTPTAQPASYEGSDKCASCHKQVSPDIVYQYASSTMAHAGVRCVDCHVVDRNNPNGKEHEGFFITNSPTPLQCQRCHPAETEQFYVSRHSGPAWMALTGLDDFTAAQRKLVLRIPEVNRDSAGIVTATRNSLFDIETPSVTKMACQSCHSIGKPNADGSIGNCNKCHLRHEFSLAQVRKPEVCGQCHLGPDHPQEEIYAESAHGAMYHTEGSTWNWSQRPGRLSTADMPAPTCATCHMSGFGTQATTHDVGQRLSKFLFAAMTTNRPNAFEGREAMVSVCMNCHTRPFVENEYAKADSVTSFVTAKVREVSAMMNGLVKDGIISAKPFATQISFDAFDLWHYYGRTAKFGAYMQGPDYTQWHGIYPLLAEYTRVKEEAARLRAEHRNHGQR